MKTYLAVIAFIGLLAVNASSRVYNFGEARAYKLLKLPKMYDPEERFVKWGALQFETPAVLTYALATETTSLGIDVGECKTLEAFDLGSANSDSIKIDEEITLALAMWEDVTQIQFRRVQDPTKADFLIGMAASKLNSVRAQVGLKRGVEKNQQIQSLEKAALCLNRDEAWTLNEAHQLSGEKPLLSLRLIVAHEVGHILGLNHPRDERQLMGGHVQEGSVGLEPGDIQGIRLLYGQ